MTHSCSIAHSAADAQAVGSSNRQSSTGVRGIGRSRDVAFHGLPQALEHRGSRFFGQRAARGQFAADERHERHGE